MDVRRLTLAVWACMFCTPVVADPISGFVNADGTVLLQSSLYKVKHTKTGQYQILFTTPIMPSASCIITPIGANYAVGKLMESDTECTVELDFFSSKADGSFSFIALPMSD